jgi:hypothetical protein
MYSDDVEAFISKLKQANLEWLQVIGEDSYRRSGGAHAYEPEAGLDAATFVNGYADGFGEAIRDGKLTAAQIEHRALMYPDSGFRMAVTNGQRQAMKERGAKRWRRILGESISGPCAECTADSLITHDISETFLDHPHGQCSQQFLQYTMVDGTMTEMPVPSDENERIRRRRI